MLTGEETSRICKQYWWSRQYLLQARLDLATKIICCMYQGPYNKIDDHGPYPHSKNIVSEATAVTDMLLMELIESVPDRFPPVESV
jgi:hypothetical protein